MNHKSLRRMLMNAGHSSFRIHHSVFSSILPPTARGTWRSMRRCWKMRPTKGVARCDSTSGRSRPFRSDTSKHTPIAGHEASRDCAVVRRSSGGGAIMHDFDVTYSLAVPDGHPLAVNRLRTYRVVHDALIEVLAGMGIEAWLFASGDGGLGCGDITPAARREPFLCFQRRAPGDVLVKGEKIAGTRQRRRRGGRAAAWQPALGPIARRPGIGWSERTDRADHSGRRIHTGVVRKAFRRIGSSLAPRHPLREAASPGRRIG